MGTHSKWRQPLAARGPRCSAWPRPLCSHRVYARGMACRVMRSHTPSATSKALSSASTAVRSYMDRLDLRQAREGVIVGGQGRAGQGGLGRGRQGRERSYAPALCRAATPAVTAAERGRRRLQRAPHHHIAAPPAAGTHRLIRPDTTISTLTGGLSHPLSHASSPGCSRSSHSSQ